MMTRHDWRRVSKWVFGTLIVAFALIQVVPVDRENPPVESEIPADEEVRAILRRSCYDCHSNETVWPWYSRIAPVSWLLARDVKEGREAMNFSTWNRYDEKERREMLKDSWDTVEDDEMPPPQYLPPHPEARLSAGDEEILREWSRSETRRSSGRGRGRGRR